MLTKILTSKPQQFTVDPKFREQLEQIEKENLAFRKYLLYLLKKTWKTFKYQTLDKLIFVRYYFNKINDIKNQSKLRNLQFFLLKKYIENIRSKTSSRKQLRAKHERIYQICTLRKNKNMFLQFKKAVVLQKKSKQLNLVCKKKYLFELISFIQESHQAKKLKQIQLKESVFLINQNYQFQLLQKVFKCFLLYRKITQIERINKKINFICLIKRIQHFNKTAIKINKYYEKNRKKQIFFSLKHDYLAKKAILFHKKSLQLKYFSQWRLNLPEIQRQNNLGRTYQVLLKMYWERKHKIFLLKIIQNWHRIICQLKQNRQHTQIIRKYAEIKSKQSLLRKYFDRLIENKKASKMSDFYGKKLKYKVFEGLKIFFLNQSVKLQNVVKFIQNRQFKKYFKRIKMFIHQEKQKIELYQKRRLFNKFMLNITLNYYFLQKRANQYLTKNLQFKVIYGLKNEVQNRKRQNYFIIHLNVTMTIKRWLKHHRIKQFVRARIWKMKTLIFRQMKMMVIIKQSKLQIEQEETSFFRHKNQEQIDTVTILETISKIKNNFLAEKNKQIN